MVADLPPFDFDLALELVPLAFRAYVDERGGKASRGSDGTTVRYATASFVVECFDAMVTVELQTAEGLPKQAGAGEAVLTGSESDPYCLLSVVEGKGRGAADADVDVRHVARSTTRWRLGDNATDRTASWDGERHTL